jgi:hypothetical protein
MEKINREILVCECESLEHQFAIWYDDEDNTLYIEPHLKRKSLRDRILYAIDYIFGRQSNYGAFDEIIINPKDAETMIEYLEKIKQNGQDNDKTNS